MRMRAFLFSTVLAILAVTACSPRRPGPATAQPSKPADNIILLIGDGMGAEVVGLARDYARVSENKELWIEKVASEGHLALVHVPPLDALVTDSAAAGTALATGQKTVNTKISMSPQDNPLTTILELARKDSRATGLVTTTGLSHATPACFAAHAAHRDSEREIAEQLLAAGVDVMMGGGMRYWIPEDRAISDFADFAGESERRDDMGLLEKAAETGYRLVTNRDELATARGAAKLLGLFAPSHLPYALDRRPDDPGGVPSLAEMTEAALDTLSRNDNGFFLMVEGGRIDHAAHANDVSAMIAETLDFDGAVGVAYAFAKKHPGTALFITADHATGAPCLTARYSDEAGKTVYPDKATMRRIARQDASFEHILRPLARNPSIAELKKRVAQHTGIEISDEDAVFILKMEPISPFHVIKPKYRKLGGYATLAMGRVLGIEYGTSWGTAEHYAAPVLLIGYGPRADLVRGYIDNTDVFKIMKTAGGL